MIMEKKQHPTFAEYNIAYDAETKIIFEALQTQGVPYKYIKLLSKVYEHSTDKIKLQSMNGYF